MNSSETVRDISARYLMAAVEGTLVGKPFLAEFNHQPGRSLTVLIAERDSGEVWHETTVFDLGFDSDFEAGAAIMAVARVITRLTRNLRAFEAAELESAGWDAALSELVAAE